MKRAFAAILSALVGCAAHQARDPQPEPPRARERVFKPAPPPFQEEAPKPITQAVWKPTIKAKRRPTKVGAIDPAALLRGYDRRAVLTAEVEVQTAIARYGKHYGYDLILSAEAPEAISLSAKDITWNVLRLLNSPANLRREARRVPPVDRTGESVSAVRLRGLRAVAEPFGVELLASWEGADLVLDCDLDGTDERGVARFRNAIRQLNGDERVGRFRFLRPFNDYDVKHHKATADRSEHMTFRVRLLLHQG